MNKLLITLLLAKALFYIGISWVIVITIIYIGENGLKDLIDLIWLGVANG